MIRGLLLLAFFAVSPVAVLAQNSSDPLFKSDIRSPKEKRVIKIFDTQGDGQYFDSTSEDTNPYPDHEIDLNVGLVTLTFFEEQTTIGTTLFYKYTIYQNWQLNVGVQYSNVEDREDSSGSSWSTQQTLGVTYNFGSRYLGESFYIELNINAEQRRGVEGSPTFLSYEIGKRFPLTRYVYLVPNLLYEDKRSDGTLNKDAGFFPIAVSVIF